MRESLNETPVAQLTQKLIEKKNLYNKILSEDKEFEEVKTLFMEIRELEKSMQETQAKNSGDLTSYSS